jgi:hypothetical protein
MDDSLISSIFEKLPMPNNTTKSWTETVQIYRDAGLYHDEPIEELTKRVIERIFDSDPPLDHMEQQLWTTLSESLLSLAGRPSFVTGIIYTSKE